MMPQRRKSFPALESINEVPTGTGVHTIFNRSLIRTANLINRKVEIEDSTVGRMVDFAVIPVVAGDALEDDQILHHHTPIPN